ncbi:MAG TPA: hypothetical protein VIS54_07355 [Psychromonas sp.]
MLTKNRVVQLLVMLIVLVTLFTWRTMTAESEQANNNVELTSVEPLSALLDCDYVKPCELVSDHGTFWLSVDNPPIKAEQWINFRLKSNEKEWHVVDAKIVGKEMFMGRIPVTFRKIERGVYAAKTLVGACTNPKMIWQLQINIQVNGINELLSADFVIEK